MRGTFLLGLFIAAAPTAPAQTLAEALRLLPDQVASVSVVPDRTLAEARMNQASLRVAGTPFGPFKQALGDLLPELKIPEPDLGNGPVLVGSFPGTGPDRDVTVVPAPRFRNLVSRLGGVKDGGLYRAKIGDRTAFLVQRGRFVLLARDRALLGAFAPGRGLDRELGRELPWLSRQTVALVVPGKSLHAGLENFRRTQADLKDPRAQALTPMVRPLLDALATSASQAALAVELPEDGSVRIHARLFLGPGSAAAKALADLPAAVGHPLAGLPAEPFALAAGGPWPAGATGLLGGFMSFATTRAFPGASQEQAAALAELQRQMLTATQGFAYTLGVPAKAGDPLFSRLRVVTRVADATAYLDLAENLAEAQDRTGGVPWAQRTTKRDVLDGKPYLTQVTTFNLDRLPGGAAIPPMQMKVALLMLFGSPDQLTVTTGVADDRRLLTVMGGPEALRLALSEDGAALPSDPRLAQADRLLPAGAPWRLYLDLKGIRDLAGAVLEGLQPPDRRAPLPAVPAAPPLVLALDCSPAAVDLTGAATPETLDALGAVISVLKSRLPAARTAAKI